MSLTAFVGNRYFFAPWEDELFHALHHAESSIDIVVPFMKLAIVKKAIASIPTVNRVRISVLSRFDKQVFLQRSSDLDAFDLLLNYCTRYYDVRIYRLANLHAKIYAIDGKVMYISSSNLSHSGLITNFEVSVKISHPQDIIDVRNAYAPHFDDEQRVDSCDLAPMADSLRWTLQSLIGRRDMEDIPVFSREEYEPELSETILLGQQDQLPAEMACDVLEQKRTAEEIQSINVYFKERGTTDFASIPGHTFSSTRVPYVDAPIEITEDRSDRVLEVRRAAREEFRLVAAADLQHVTAHLQNLFGSYISANSGLAVLRDAFIHNSFRFSCSEGGPNEIHDLRHDLGGALHQSLIAWAIVRKSLFTSAREFGAMLTYIQQNYPYDSVLQDTGLHFCLHSADLPKDFSYHLFVQILGALYLIMPWGTFLGFYRRFLDKCDQLESDVVCVSAKETDYKCYLQEAAERAGLRPPHYSVAEKAGPEHARVFTVELRLGRSVYARGTGQSLKDAEKDAAYLGLRRFGEKHGLPDATRPGGGYRLTRYIIDPDRRSLLQECVQKCPFDVRSIELLDCALTHKSYEFENRSTRSNTRLAFLGAHVHRLARLDLVMRPLCHEIDKETLVSMRRELQQELQSKYPARLFDGLGLNRYYRLGLGQTKAAVSDAMKADCIQAIIAVHFLDGGPERTMRMVDRVREEYRADSSSGKHSDPVSDLQEEIQRLVRTQPIPIKYEVLQIPGTPCHDAEYRAVCYINDIVVGEGRGKTKKAARKAAASMALAGEADWYPHLTTNGG